jgi:hypothetical protein
MQRSIDSLTAQSSYTRTEPKESNQQNLSRGEDFNTVIAGSIIGKDDNQLALGQANADLENKESSSNLKFGGWSSSLVRTLALRAKGRRSESGSAHHNPSTKSARFKLFLTQPKSERLPFFRNVRLKF